MIQGKYANLHLSFLRENHPAEAARLKKEGLLEEYLKTIQTKMSQAVEQRMTEIEKAIQDEDGKSKSYTKRLNQLSHAKSRAEEELMPEIIWVPVPAESSDQTTA